MKLATIISALRAYCPSFEGRVGGAAEYAAIDITNLPMPCAFVLPVSEIGEDMDSMGPITDSVSNRSFVLLFWYLRLIRNEGRMLLTRLKI